MTATPSQNLDYPYGIRPLRPAWRSLKGLVLAMLALGCAGTAATRASLAGLPVNDIALLTVLPGMLAFTLAFSPEPRTRLGTMAKDLLCIATALAPLAHGVPHLLILGVPLLLAGAVAIDKVLPPGLRVPECFRMQERAT